MSWYVPVVKGTPPTARYAHTATPVGSKLFIFGGCGENRCFSELHVLDTGLFEACVRDTGKLSVRKRLTFGLQPQ